MNDKSVINFNKLMEPLYKVKGWIKCMGVLSIIAGVICVFTIWGIIVCWVPIWVGVVLISASNHIRLAFENNDNSKFRTSMEKLGLYFRIGGIVGLVGSIIYFVAVVVMVIVTMQT
jgi:hypothetical protein